MTAWESVDEESPFGGVAKVDGLVYRQDDIAVELRATADLSRIPLPPQRTAPRLPAPRNSGPWQPTQVDRSQFLPDVKGRSVLRMIVMGLIPITIAVAVLLGALIYVIEQLGVTH